jgi:hypothetical protein
VFHGPQLPRVLKVLALSSHNLYLSVLYRLSQAICRAILCNRWLSLCMCC